MSLRRSIGDPLRSPPALSDAEQQLQRLHVLDPVMGGLAGVRTLGAAELRRAALPADRAGRNSAARRLSEIDLATYFAAVMNRNSADDIATGCEGGIAY
jgi:hypothetical protein